MRRHDPWARPLKTWSKKDHQNYVGAVDFGTRALLRMTGRHLQEPWKYDARDDSEIAEYLDNPQPYLSFDDSALWKKVIGNR